jgi:hypothetical protein
VSDDLVLSPREGVYTTVAHFECRNGVEITMTPLLLPAVIQLEEELENKVQHVAACLFRNSDAFSLSLLVRSSIWTLS